MGAKGKRRSDGQAVTELSARFKGPPAAFLGETAQLLVNDGGIELAEGERFAEIGKWHADAAAAGQDAGDLKERQERSGLAVLRPKETDRLVPVRVAQNPHPCRRMESRRCGMGGDKTIPRWIDGRIQYSKTALHRSRRATRWGVSEFRGLSYQWGCRHERIPRG